MVSQGLDAKVVENAEEKCFVLVETFNLHLRNKFGRYFLVFLGCEILNLAIALLQVELISLSQSQPLQVFITDRFLGGSFLSYGPDALYYFLWGHKFLLLMTSSSRHTPEETRLQGRTNPLCEAFPRVGLLGEHF